MAPFLVSANQPQMNGFSLCWHSLKSKGLNCAFLERVWAKLLMVVSYFFSDHPYNSTQRAPFSAPCSGGSGRGPRSCPGSRRGLRGQSLADPSRGRGCSSRALGHAPGKPLPGGGSGRSGHPSWSQARCQATLTGRLPDVGLSRGHHDLKVDPTGSRQRRIRRHLIPPP